MKTAFPIILVIILSIGCTAQDQQQDVENPSCWCVMIYIMLYKKLIYPENLCSRTQLCCWPKPYDGIGKGSASSKHLHSSKCYQLQSLCTSYILTKDGFTVPWKQHSCFSSIKWQHQEKPLQLQHHFLQPLQLLLLPQLLPLLLLPRQLPWQQRQLPLPWSCLSSSPVQQPLEALLAV